MRPVLFAIPVVLLLAAVSVLTGVGSLAASDDGRGWLLVVESRLPRTLALMLAGAGLAVSGTIMQMLARNRFVEPSTAGTADPDQALNHWERLFSGVVSRASTLDYLHASPRMLDLLCTIFGNSDALAFTLIRDPTLIHWLAEEDVLSSPPSRVGMEKALRASMGSLTVTELKLEALRRLLFSAIL